MFTVGTPLGLAVAEPVDHRTFRFKVSQNSQRVSPVGSAGPRGLRSAAMFTQAAAPPAASAPCGRTPGLCACPGHTEGGVVFKPLIYLSSLL